MMLEFLCLVSIFPTSHEGYILSFYFHFVSFYYCNLPNNLYLIFTFVRGSYSSFIPYS